MTGTNAETENLDFHSMPNVNGIGNPIGNQFVQHGDVIRAMEDMIITVSTRPLVDNKLIMLRIGRIKNSYRFSTEITPSETSSGSFSVETTEHYTVYPLSFGVGISTSGQAAQLQGEFIYAFATMREEQTIVTSDKAQIPLSSATYNSEMIGFRVSVQLNVYISKSFALVFEGGYRRLGFYDFTNVSTGKTVGLDYSTSGGFLHGGLSYGW